MDIANTPELLRQHGGFVRNLARALLRDPAQADDVAQEALTRWVTQPPRDTSRPRSWLATVVRGLAANTQRAEERRTRHEERVALPELVPSPLEASLQAELVQHVIGAVMALEAAQRDTILSRYFRGLTVAELAAESGTSEETLRTRERRALEKLREKLDKHFGNRSAWALGLEKLVERSLTPTSAPWNAPTGSAATGSVATWVAAAGALALVTTAATLWFSTGREKAGVEPAAAQSVDAAEVRAGGPSAASQKTPAREPATPSAAPSGTSPRNASNGPPGGSSGGSSNAFTSAELAEIRGTFLLEGGAPAAHVPWAVNGWEGNEERTLAFGLPADWVDPEGETEADGSFTVSFAPPRAFQFVFEAKAPGHAQASWRWSEILPGRVLDLGTVTLARGATVTGRLVDSAGAPILGQAWTIYLDSLGLGQREGRDDISVRAALDPTTGEFRAEDVMPGGNTLKAYSRIANWIRGQRVVAVAGTTLTADLVYTGKDNSRRIVVEPSCQPFYVVSDPDVEHIHLLAPDGTSRTAKQIEGSAQSYAFDGLAPGVYTLAIDDPRFRPWSQTGVLPGNSVPARLEGCSAVTLGAVDAAGQPLALDALTVEFRNVNFNPREIQVHDGSTPFAGSVRLVPGDYILHARAGELEGEVEVDALGFDETRTVTLTLGAGAWLSGRVVDAGGAARGGAQVLLLQPALENDSSTSPILPPNSTTGDPQLYRRQLDAVESGADGSFAFKLQRGGAYVVHAELANGLTADAPVLTLQDEESRAGLELALPRGAAVSGTLRGPSGSSWAGLRLWIGPDLDTRAGFRQFLALDEHARTLTADGSFAFEDLPAGAMQAFLLLPEDAHPTGHGWSGVWNRIEIGRFELAEGQTLTRELQATPPGIVTIDVLVNGEPAAGLPISIEQPYSTPNRPQISALLGASGSYGPAPLFPGPWGVRVSGAAEATPLSVTAGGATHVVVDVQQVAGYLTFLDAAGAALANRSVSVFFQPGEDPPFRCAHSTTDGQGRASFTLAPGPYSLRLDADSAHPSPSLEPDEVTVPLTWTTQGPLGPAIRF